MTQAERVLELLTVRGPRGVTVLDFPTGFRLSGRIKDLRDAGHPIDTETVELEGGARVARYVRRDSRQFVATAGVQEGLPL